jgi:hypothetical protein
MVCGVLYVEGVPQQKEHTMTTTTRTAWQLARLAECSDPDSDTSPGAQFLNRVESDVLERIEDNDGEWDDDYAHEIADNAVPVYTYTMWQTFVDLGAWEEDPSDLGYDEGDMAKGAAVCLYMIANRLAYALATEYEEENAA